MHLVNTGHSSQYLRDPATLTANITSRFRLRSASTGRYDTPATRICRSVNGVSRMLVRQQGIIYLHLNRTSVILKYLNETLTVNF